MAEKAASEVGYVNTTATVDMESENIDSARHARFNCSSEYNDADSNGEDNDRVLKKPKVEEGKSGAENLGLKIFGNHLHESFDYYSTLEKMKRKVQELANAHTNVEYSSTGVSLAAVLAGVDLAEIECAKLKRELAQKRKLALERYDEAQMKRKVEEIGQELVNGHKNFGYAASRADLAEKGWIKAMRKLEEEQEDLQLLMLECEIRGYALGEVEKKKLEIAKAKLSDPLKEISSLGDEACAICLSKEKDMAFGCGHMTCKDCGFIISRCPICRELITSRLRLYPG